MLFTELAKILIPKRNLYVKLKEEDLMCVQFAAYVRQLSLENKLPYVWFHIPNQLSGTYKPIFGLKQSWMGRMSGIPDYCFMGEKSFFIEFKSKKGKLSPGQVIFEKWSKHCGVPFYMCKSFEEAKEIIDSL